MTFISTRRTAAAIAAAICIAIPATAQADSDAAQLPGARSAASAPGHLLGKHPSARQADATSTFPSADFRGGDNPADHPGMSRAPQYDGPTTIEVVQPERTIVRDVDEALPIALAGTALLLVLATLGITLVRMRLVPRPGRSS
jgi:hypothetical protein